MKIKHLLADQIQESFHVEAIEILKDHTPLMYHDLIEEFLVEMYEIGSTNEPYTDAILV